MYLERIETQGFKTFADRTALDFLPPKKGSKGITAIVGPNGSGKSNIADAVRWVLGEQSMKLIRGKKAQDVIWGGSDKRARAGFAEVSLTLNNEDKAVPGIEYDKVVITRRLYRDGESEYLINKNKVRLTDVQLLLAQANFGQRTYSVIGQGMVDAILVASPKERKEFFDDAAGVRQYQLKREQSVRKLASSEENLKQAELVLTELEPRMKYLSRQVRRLEERAELEKELIGLEYDYFGASWHAIQDELKKIDARTKTVEEDRKAKEKEIEKLRADLAGMETEETNSDGLTALQKEYEKLLEQRNGLREKELRLKNRIELEKARAKAEAPEALPMPLPKIIDEIAEISKAHDALVKKVLSAKDLDAAKKAAEDMQALGKSISELLKELKEPGHKQKTEAKEADPSPELEKELGGVAEEMERISKTLAETQEKMRTWGRKEAETRKEFFETQKHMQTIQNELFGLDRHLSDHRVERARVETRLEALKQEAGEYLEDDAEKALHHKPKEQVDPQELAPRLHKLRTQVASIGAIDRSIVDEYKEAKERYDFLTGQVTDLRETKIQLEAMIDDLDGLIKKRSDEAFKRINKEFDAYFKRLFDGGSAALKKIEQEEEPEDALEEDEEADERSARERKKEAWLGLDISANPPGKRVKNIHVLSGGERALTSIALICAILTTNPSPFVVLDEVDAALDESNASKFAAIVADLAHSTQFILITHNRYTMEKAQVLYGVTMRDDSTSRMLSLKLEEAEDVIKKRKLAAGAKS